MSSAHYSLRWNNHQAHLLTAFDSLLQNETLVDVTLVCEETSFKAHKVVLSACSPYFQRIFSETPCKHPVIVLKDLKGWEVQAIVDFMYRGEISVGQEQLPTLIKAAESLQVRGLAHTERIPVTSKEGQNCYSPSYQSEIHSPSFRTPSHIPYNGVSERQSASPIPRRKQARPRRRSGDACGAQDLSKGWRLPPPADSAAENLSTKPARPQSPVSFKVSPTPPPSTNVESEESSLGGDGQAVELTTERRDEQSQPSQQRLDFDPPPLPPAPLPPAHHPPNYWKKYDMSPFSKISTEMDSPLDSSFPPHLASISQLSLTPPHMFSLESSLGLFPGLENCRSGLLGDLPEPRLDNHHIPVKKKRRCFVVGRPKGQHSAPRGGPPRSWTNAELTEALQHVWNKKMTTSQASRIFGIPYNSLLMYVRGKYGKSLKLEQLKKECFGDGPLDLLNISNNNNPTPKSLKLPPEPDLMLGPPGFNPSAGYPSTNFYPDFSSSFPVPVGMVHLLPQSEKNREPMNMSLDFSKDGPLDFAKESPPAGDRAPTAPLDFVKEEHHTSCIDEENKVREIQQHNGD